MVDWGREKGEAIALERESLDGVVGLDDRLVMTRRSSPCQPLLWRLVHHGDEGWKGKGLHAI